MNNKFHKQIIWHKYTDVQ